MNVVSMESQIDASSAGAVVPPASSVPGQVLFGTAADDTLVGSDGDDALWGGVGDDVLEGGIGADTLKGQAGADTLRGGAGDDYYLVDRAGDLVIELADEGLDRVRSSAPVYTLPEHVEELVFEPVWYLQSFIGHGHAGDNLIQGADASDRLFGVAGDDTLVGRQGNDLLDGGGGTDSMRGGVGDDLYVVDRASDVVQELAGQGRDSVRSSVSWILPDEVENLTLTSVDAITGRGNALANVLTGSASGNTLLGLDGADTLDGAAGADTLKGGLGDDTYFVDDAGDLVIEFAGQGSDRVVSKIGLTLPRHVERLDLGPAVGPVDGDGNALANVIQGNRAPNQARGGDGADSLWGGGGVDTLLGGRGDDFIDGGSGDDVQHGGRGNDTLLPAAGRDTLYGGPGDDTYVVESTDVVIGEAADAGRDLVKSRISYALGAHLEDLQLVGGGNRSGVGNRLDNLIQGGNGDDELIGGAGNDTLVGNNGDDRLLGGEGRDELRMAMGQDSLSGGGGADLFVITLETGRDLVTDFARGSDKLALATASFGDRDDTIEGAVVVGAGQRFPSLAELVIIDTGYTGPLSAVADGGVIGDASEAFRLGRQVLFVVGNGTATGLYGFRAADADARVEAYELTYLGQLAGVPAPGLDDFLLSPSQINAWWG